MRCVAAEKQLGRVRPMWQQTDTSELDQLRKKQTLLNLWQYIFSGQRLLLVHSRKSFVHGLMTSMQSTTILLCLRPFFHSEEQTLKHPNSWASLLLTSLMQKSVRRRCIHFTQNWNSKVTPVRRQNVFTSNISH